MSGIIDENNITCVICSNIYVNPVMCLKCNNSICKECYIELEKSYKLKNKKFDCPYCRNFPFDVEINEQLNNFLKTISYICKKCKLKYNDVEQFQEHKKLCGKYKCKICLLSFDNPNKYFEHFNNDKKDVHKKIILYFADKNKKNINYWENIFIKEIKLLRNESEKILNKLNYFNKENNNENLENKNNNNYDNKNSEINNNNNNEEKDDLICFKDSNQIHEYMNFLDLKKENEFDKIFKSQIKNKLLLEEKIDINQNDNNNNNINLLNELKILNIPEKCEFINKYKLFFCFKQTNINCECCPEHICKPGCCMCQDCMSINKKIFNLKNHYLINKAGRASKFSYGSFHCHCKYENIEKTQVGNIFISIKWCHFPNKPCKACIELTKNMDYYLKPEIIKKLKNRV